MRFRFGRIVDALAVAAIIFLAYKFLLAPRALDVASATPAPAVQFRRLDGGQVSLGSLRGRVVFLDFWASWCEPCRASLPFVERFARTHPDVRVLPVNVGEPAPVVRDFARRNALSRVVLDPQTETAERFGVVGFPTMVVIDPHGRIRATWSGYNPAIQLNMDHAAQVLRGD